MEYYDICLVVCCVVLLIELVVAFLIARYKEQEHQKRMENIEKGKKTGLMPVLVIFLFEEYTPYCYYQSGYDGD